MKNKLSSLRKRLRKASEMLSHNVFDAYDYNEDKMVGRDEWEGSDEVFSLLDSNKDEYLDDFEVSQGLGSSFSKLADSKYADYDDDRILTPQEIADLMGGKLINP